MNKAPLRLFEGGARLTRAYGGDKRAEVCRGRALKLLVVSEEHLQGSGVKEAGSESGS